MSVIEQLYGKEDYELIQREPCFEGFFRMEKIHLRYKRFDGTWSRDIAREVFMRGNATCVLPYDPVEDKVVLVEQFRPGAVFEDQSPWLLELVAGMNEEGEKPEDVASREALEEADLVLGELEKVCEFLVSPGGTTEKVFLYCAKVDSLGVGGIHGLLSEDEDIKVHALGFDEAMSLVADGTINNASAIIAIQWLALNRENMKAKWA